MDKVRKLKIDSDIIELYTPYDGMLTKWTSGKYENIGGCIHLLKLEQVIKSREGYLYESDEISENPDIRFFHPIDLISEEAQCGIIIDPKEKGNQLAYNYSGEMELEFLNLDFKGYIEMAFEARVFNYWPLVILDIKKGEESETSKMFKEYMPKIFKNFSYESTPKSRFC